MCAVLYIPYRKLYSNLQSMGSKVAKYNMHAIIEEGSRLRVNKAAHSTRASKIRGLIDEQQGVRFV